MAKIALHVDDPAQRLTLRGLLLQAGHDVTERVEADVCIADSPARAVRLLDGVPVLVLCPASEAAAAVKAMEEGVFGYILIPLQPGEAAIMVRRALQWAGRGRSTEAVDSGFGGPLAEVEKRHIQETVRRCKHNHARAARILGIGRNTLWRKLKRYEAEEDG